MWVDARSFFSLWSDFVVLFFIVVALFFTHALEHATFLLYD
jgi:hypothetical protein